MDKKKVEELVLKYQNLERQYQTVLLQLQQLRTRDTELSMALEEVDKLNDDGEIYKSAGPILMRTTKEEAKKDLSEKKRLGEVRIKSLEKQEENLRLQLESVSSELEKFIGKPPGGSS